MADILHKNLPEKLITRQNLIDEGFAINKKFVMVDSRAYTPEAFEYVLKLADLVGSLVFVYDTKKIWANGRYFGGDIFQEDLQYFSEIITLDKDDNFTGITRSDRIKDSLRLKGLNHVQILASFDEETAENLITFDYNLKNAVNSERIEIDGAKYNLVVENGQVKLNQYKPMVVTLQSLSPLEYDSVPDFAEVSFRLYIQGTIPDPSAVKLELNVMTEDGTEITENIKLDEDTNTITALVPANVNTKFTIAYTDGETTGTVSTWQKWGYKILIGLFRTHLFDYLQFVDPNVRFEDLYNYIDENIDDSLIQSIIWVPGTRFSKTVNIDVGVDSLGVLICPYNMDLEFTDTSINLIGGWRPVFDKTGKKYLADKEREFIVWRTDHNGIGLVNWKIVGEETKNTEVVD